MERRSILKTAVAASIAGSPAMAEENPPVNGVRPEVGASAGGGAEGLLLRSDPGERRGEMLYRPLGRTGEMVSAIGLGGAHIGKAKLSEKEAIRLMHEAIERGITFMDNCWDYNDGNSELRMGRALQEGNYRDKVFLMTKFDGRTKEEAAKQIETSLDRLRTDRIDLAQHHEIIRFDDPDRIFAAAGAMEAFLEAQQAGKIRHIGFTGHKDPHIHLYTLDVAAQHGFAFDTCQLPLNVMDAHFRSFAHLVLPRLVQEDIGVLGMKSMGSGVILQSGAVTPVECLHYALSLPTSVVITGIDSQEVLDQAFAAVKDFQPLGREQIAALLAKTAQAAQQGDYELFKTSMVFDSTAQHPEWLGGLSPRAQELMNEKS